MSNAKTIKKAVLPVAGLGTRFLPATKAIPKEMLPIVDTPLVEFAVREAIEAGIEEIIFVTSHTKRSIEDHFDRNLELESKLSSSNKESYLDKVNLNEYEGIKFSFVRQRDQRGLGDAISQVSHLIRPDEYFAILLADDLFDGNPGVTSQLVDAFKLHGKSIIAVNEVSEEETKKYGVISGELSGNLTSVEEIVEKPQSNPPSNLAVTGRYLLSGEIMEELKTLEPGFGNEIQLTDAIAKMLQKSEMLGLKYDALKFDCGSKEGFVQANIHFAKKQHIIS
jgi:UTP--glucose-1-phosphate uridylyltransferase